MGISRELISQFVKNTKDNSKDKTETTVYGTIVESNGSKYVQLDGSELLTPIGNSTTADISDGERVTVMIKNHTAIVTGNISSPSAKASNLDGLIDDITQVEILVADKATVKDLEVERGRIDDLVTDNVLIKDTLFASEAVIDELEADNVVIKEQLKAHEADISYLESTKIDAATVEANYATIEDLDATNVDIHNLEATYAEFEQTTTEKIEAIEADIASLDVENLDATYANIDFSNIGKAAIEQFFSKSGMIKDLVVSDGTITGQLVGVTISGDLIEGNTVKAEKLVVKGSDGLYYKLNIDGGATTSEKVTKEDLQNGLHGSVIIAKSITAEKVSVDDLVAFGATIGGFHITDDSIHSGTKTSVDNTTRGIYLDDDGQAAIGDTANFLKYYKKADGTYALEISASSILLGTSKKSVETAFGEVQSSVDNIEIGSRNLYKRTGDFDSAYWEQYISVEPYENNPIYKQAKCGGNTYLLSTLTSVQGFDFSDTLKTWTISVMAKATADDQMLGITLDANRTFFGMKSIPNGEWKKMTWTFQGSTSLITFRFEGYNASADYPIYLAQVMVEEGNKASGWRPAPEDVDSDIQVVRDLANTAQATADQNAADMANAITSFNADIVNLQTQIDGSITTWFYEVAPTSTNEPAVKWTTTDLKNVHLGDIYYDTITGYCYRWQVSNNVYSWQRITDTDVTKALNDAQKAQDTADNKKRVFYVTPTPPYDAGDLWVQGSTGGILYCKTAKAAGQSYLASDWVVASKYTDDTVANNAQNAANNAQADIDNLAIGGRNLIVRVTEMMDYWIDTSGAVTSTTADYYSATSEYIEVEPSTNYMLSRKESSAMDGGFFRIAWYDETYTFISRAPYGALEQLVTSPSNAKYIRIAYPYDAYPKFEKGNRATDWTPAPEDMATANEVGDVASTANDAQTRVATAEALIEVLSESISMLVTDGNGASLMTQTEDGWTFSTAEMQALIDSTSEGLNDLTHEVGDVNNTVGILQQAVDDLGTIAEYVKITTYEDEPCIELGEGDSDFKLLITNTRIMFREGTNVPAYFNNQSMHIQKAVIEEELQQGSFVWKVRSNGNMGLVWKGGTS